MFKIDPFIADFPPSILSPNKGFSWARISAVAEYRLLLRSLTQQAMRKSKVSQANIQEAKKNGEKMIGLHYILPIPAQIIDGGVIMTTLRPPLSLVKTALQMH